MISVSTFCLRCRRASRTQAAVRGEGSTTACYRCNEDLVAADEWGITPEDEARWAAQPHLSLDPSDGLLNPDEEITKQPPNYFEQLLLANVGFLTKVWLVLLVHGERLGNVERLAALKLAELGEFAKRVPIPEKRIPRLAGSRDLYASLRAIRELVATTGGGYHAFDSPRDSVWLKANAIQVALRIARENAQLTVEELVRLFRREYRDVHTPNIDQMVNEERRHDYNARPTPSSGRKRRVGVDGWADLPTAEEFEQDPAFSRPLGGNWKEELLARWGISYDQLQGPSREGRITEARRRLIVALDAEGIPSHDIAAFIDRDQSYVSRLLAEHHKQGIETPELGSLPGSASGVDGSGSPS